MCQAVAEMIEEARIEGRNEALLSSVKALMESFLIRMEQSMEALHLTEAERNYCIQAEMHPQ